MKVVFLVLIAVISCGCSLIVHTEFKPVEFQVYILNSPQQIPRWNKTLLADGYDTYRESEVVVSAIAKSKRNESAISLLYLSDDISGECDVIASVLESYFPISNPRATLNGSLEDCREGIEKTHPRFLTPYSLHITITGDMKRRYQYIRTGSVCRDGSISSSIGSGTCSWHGGVSEPYYRKRYME